MCQFIAKCFVFFLQHFELIRGLITKLKIHFNTENLTFKMTADCDPFLKSLIL